MAVGSSRRFGSAFAGIGGAVEWRAALAGLDVGVDGGVGMGWVGVGRCRILSVEWSLVRIA